MTGTGSEQEMIACLYLYRLNFLLKRLPSPWLAYKVIVSFTLRVRKVLDR